MSDAFKREKYRELAKKALNKPPKYGPDIDITPFIPKEARGGDIRDFSGVLSEVGIDLNRESPGIYYQIESNIISAMAKQPGVEILSLEEALDRYSDFIYDYFWNAVRVDTDKFTALAELKGRGGYVIIVKEGVSVKMPIQTCLLMEMNKSLQAPHNIIIAEPKSEVSILTGCTAMRETVGLHAGVTEMYVGEGARISFVMIHRWSEAMHIRPRTGVIVEDSGEYVSHYIAFTKLKTFQSMPKVILKRNAKAFLSSLVVLESDGYADSGYSLELMGEGASGQIISRSITRDTAKIVARARIAGDASNTRGHIDCQGLLLSKRSEILTIPILEAKIDDVSLTHEAAVGKLSEEKILWLMARGFSREDAESILIRGFMRVDLPHLTPPLRAMIDNTIKQISKSVL